MVANFVHSFIFDATLKQFLVSHSTTYWQSKQFGRQLIEQEIKGSLWLTTLHFLINAFQDLGYSIRHSGCAGGIQK